MSNTGKADPGWNDPPMFAYNPDITPAKPRSSLNKRVALSFNSASTTSESKPPISVLSSLSSIPTKVIVNSPMSNTEDINNKTISQSSSPYSFLNTIDIFKKLVDESPELGKKVADIEKRLKIMESMWKEGKLNDDVQSKTHDIAKALLESDVITADNLHKSLMVDHVSTVSSWMVGIKQLILHYTAKNDLISIDAES